ncbi:MAG: Fur family transcriptional regulator [Pseudorhodoplanes sp.]
MTHTVFPAPDHDHGRCTADALAHADALCLKHGQRLTASRRQVLEALLESHRPLGAYDIIDRVAQSGARPAPITVYRALDFLIENGLVHRIESRNAFIACIHTHDTDDVVMFLICERCGAVGEMRPKPVADALKSATRSAGFAARAPVIEVAGICAHCQAA